MSTPATPETTVSRPERGEPRPARGSRRASAPPRDLLPIALSGLALGLALGAVLIASGAQAAGPAEMNVRQGIANGSLNKIASARLRGMLAGEGASGRPSGGDDDCTTQIGNRAEGGSLLDRPADVIVVGDVINVCR